MNKEVAIKLFHQACTTIMESNSKASLMPYAKSYANRGLKLNDPESIVAQIPYIQGNLTGWRGDDARMARAKLKDAYKALK
jgi:hypothetical protein